MNEVNMPMQDLRRDLEVIAKTGIQTCPEQLKKDMVMQFGDPRFYIREYATNAHDANARTCTVSGREDEKTITIIIEDDGHGMGRQAVLDWLRLFKSVKTSSRRPPVGEYGVGKLSVAAIPGQCGFLMNTSTGKECWRLTAACLLDSSPIRLERVTPLRRRGTCFEITFVKDEKCVDEELKALHEILRGSVRYLPMTTLVYYRDDKDAPAARPHVVRDEWGAHCEVFGSSHSFTVDGLNYEAIFGIGPQRCELYKRRVFVSSSYDLLNMGTSDWIVIPHLRVLVEAPHVTLVFGRHRVADEQDLNSLSRHLRRVILPRYVATLCERYREGSLKDHGLNMVQAEEIAVAMMSWDSDTFRPWSCLPVFSVCNDAERPRFSLKDLVQAVSAKGILYLADEGMAGIDFSVFDAPVLSSRQPAGALELLKKVFGNQLVHLGAQDVVIEAPSGTRPELGDREKRFQRMLRFHPAAARRQVSGRTSDGSTSRQGKRRRDPTPEELERLLAVCREAHEAKVSLENIEWRVSWLLERDGTTPSHSHRYLFKNDRTVILNLHHPEVERMLHLSERAPALAGYFGLASCMSDGTKILPHLSKEAREDLLRLDAMAKVGITEPEDMAAPPEDWDSFDPSPSWLEFLRNTNDPDFEIP